MSKQLKLTSPILQWSHPPLEGGWTQINSKGYFLSLWKESLSIRFARSANPRENRVLEQARVIWKVIFVSALDQTSWLCWKKWVLQRPHVKWSHHTLKMWSMRRRYPCSNGLSDHDLPLNVVNDPLTRGISNLIPTSRETLRNRILHCYERMNKDMKGSPEGKKILLIFDAQSEGSDHYLGVAALHLTSSILSEHGEVLLSVWPMLEEDGVDNFTAEGHKTHFSTVSKQCDIKEEIQLHLQETIVLLTSYLLLS